MKRGAKGGSGAWRVATGGGWLFLLSASLLAAQPNDGEHVGNQRKRIKRYIKEYTEETPSRPVAPVSKGSPTEDRYADYTATSVPEEAIEAYAKKSRERTEAEAKLLVAHEKELAKAYRKRMQQKRRARRRWRWGCGGWRCGGWGYGGAWGWQRYPLVYGDPWLWGNGFNYWHPWYPQRYPAGRWGRRRCAGRRCR